MKKIILIFLIVFIALSCYPQTAKQLTTKQKIEDFEYFYELIRENYPFLGVYERKTGKNWLSLKQQYIDSIKQTPDDVAFLSIMRSAIYGFEMGHLSMRPTYDYHLYVNGYTQLSTKKPKYKRWLKILKNQNQRTSYWQDLQKDIWKNSVTNFSSKASKKEINLSNVSIQILSEMKTGILRIASFSPRFFAEDSTKISRFFKEIRDFDYLIIDIQDNYGGGDNYWKQLIVEKLINQQIKFAIYQVIKNGEINRRFYPEVFRTFAILKPKERFPNIPKELLDTTYLFKKRIETIKPTKSINFKGKIFLLTNRNVMSASESFVYFCKSTKWTTVAGERTGGDGMCGEPTLFVLPNSGIICNFPSLFSLNPDGTINAEVRTIPDMFIDADNSDERLNKLIKKIQNN